MINKPAYQIIDGEIHVDKCPKTFMEAFDMWWEVQGKPYFIGKSEELSEGQMLTMKSYFASCFFAGVGWAITVPAVTSVPEWEDIRSKHEQLEKQSKEN